MIAARCTQSDGDSPPNADYHARMMPTRLFMPLVLLLALNVLTAGCRTNPFGERPENLVYKTRTFEDVVRWGALEKMYLFGKREEGQTLDMQPGLRNVRVTGYELAEELRQIEPMRWRQTAIIRYVLTDRQVVRELMDHQVWQSDDEGESWYRANPVPLFQ